MPAGASRNSYLKAVAVLGDGRECEALHSDPIAFDENNLYFGTELMWTMKRKAYQKFCSNKAKVKVSVGSMVLLILRLIKRNAPSFLKSLSL